MRCLCGEIAHLHTEKRLIEYRGKPLILDYECYRCPNGHEFANHIMASKIQRQMLDAIERDLKRNEKI